MYDRNRTPLTPQQLNQPEVRPWLKRVAAVFAVLLAAMFAFGSMPLFSATSLAVMACTETRVTSRLLCELGNLVLSRIPAQYRGIYEGVLYLLLAAALMVAAFRLFRSSRR